MGEAENVLNSRSKPDASWSTINLAEAMPGVATPLGWSFWGPAGELGARAPFLAMGALPASQAVIPDDPEDRVINIFFGRVAGRVDFFCEMGDLIPGVTGEGIARDVFGFVPPNYVSRPSRRRWPVCAAKLPATFLRIPSVMHRTRRDTEAWWRSEIARHGSLDLAGAKEQLAAAAQRFRDTLALQAINVACGIQPLYEQVGALAKAARIDGAKLMTGHGSHEETAVIQDLWAVSRDRLSLDAFLARHGYHGPHEGEISGRVWREDPAPVRHLVAGYRSVGDDVDPARTVRTRAAERSQLEAGLLVGLPRARRYQARLLLRLVARYLPLRGVGKVAFLQSIDVGRAAARQIGALLAASSVLVDPEDVFLLTVDELTGAFPADAKGLVEERRAIRARYQGLELASPCWTGAADARPIVAAERVDSLTGVAASPGLVEGRVRVVTDPAAADMEPGEILVAHTTDPGWASLMFLAKALVVDIGGLLSHAAVVARELGIPCVMNTGVGTQVLSTRDVCRVDGNAGTVEILERAV